MEFHWSRLDIDTTCFSSNKRKIFRRTFSNRFQWSRGNDDEGDFNVKQRSILLLWKQFRRNCWIFMICVLKTLQHVVHCVMVLIIFANIVQNRFVLRINPIHRIPRSKFRKFLDENVFIVVVQHIWKNNVLCTEMLLQSIDSSLNISCIFFLSSFFFVFFQIWSWAHLRNPNNLLNPMIPMLQFWSQIMNENCVVSNCKTFFFIHSTSISFSFALFFFSMNLTKLNSDVSHRFENEVYTRSQGIKVRFLSFQSFSFDHRTTFRAFTSDCCNSMLKPFKVKRFFLSLSFRSKICSSFIYSAKLQNQLNKQNPSGSANVQGGGTAVATATTTTIRPSQPGAMLNQMSHPDPRFALNRNPTVSPRMINPQTQQTMNRLAQRNWKKKRRHSFFFFIFRVYFSLASMNPRPMTVTTTTVSPTTNVTATQPTLINNPSNIDHIRANFPSQSMNNNNFNDYLTFQPRFPTPIQTNPTRPRLPTNTGSNNEWSSPFSSLFFVHFSFIFFLISPTHQSQWFIAKLFKCQSFDQSVHISIASFVESKSYSSERQL